MKIYLLGKDILEFIELPEKITENVSLVKSYTDLEMLPLLIDGIDGKWYLKSTNKLQILVQEVYTAKVELKNYQYYVLQIVGTDKSLVLYTLPTNDKNTYNLKVTNIDKVIVGNTENCNIVYNQANFEIVKATQNNTTYWQLNNLNANNKVYVNSVASQNQILRVGDVVFSNGLKLIWMGSFLNVNNPNGLVHAPALIPYEKQMKNTDFKATELDTDLSLYQETDYFYHTLRVNQNSMGNEIEIDQVPPNQISDHLPVLLTMGTSLTMGVSSMMMAYSIFRELRTGQSTIAEQIPEILMCVAMILACIILPAATRRYEKKREKEREALRQRKYTAYLAEKQKEIADLKKNREEFLKDNNPNAMECYQLLTETEKIKNIRFWNRLITDRDFLNVRLGIGNAPSKFEISAPQKHFTLDEDGLMDQAYRIAEDAKTLVNVPITLSLLENSLTGIIINNSYRQDYINNLILQLITLHSAIDLKIVIFTNEKNARNWEYTKYLPHCWSDDKETRFFATNQSEMNEISTYLEEEYKNRKDIYKNAVVVEEKKAEEKKK